MAQTDTRSGTIAAYFEKDADARQAIEELHEAGFTSAHIGVARRNASATSHSTSTHGSVGEKAEGTWEKIKNMFVGGDEAEPYADERTQGDMANREVTQNPADRDVSAGAYRSSDLHQSFNELEVPEDRSRYFSHRLGRDNEGAVVTVQPGNRREEAESILLENGADLGNDAADYNYGSSDSASRQTQGSEGDIQLLGEVLRVHKDRINRGEVTIRKEVKSETQTVQVPVTREELVIERHAATDATPVNDTIGEREIRIPLSEERASIDKSTVVRENVSVGKKAVEDVRDLTGEVRHEELIVENPTERKRA
jgi:uncharacterized protein (TIGR02271 family)